MCVYLKLHLKIEIIISIQKWTFYSDSVIKLFISQSAPKQQSIQNYWKGLGLSQIHHWQIKKKTVILQFQKFKILFGCQILRF